jgi:hypothetical protein
MGIFSSLSFLLFFVTRFYLFTVSDSCIALTGKGYVMMAAVSNENGRVGFASNTEKKGEKKRKKKVFANHETKRAFVGCSRSVRNHVFLFARIRRLRPRL